MVKRAARDEGLREPLGSGLKSEQKPELRVGLRIGLGPVQGGARGTWLRVVPEFHLRGALRFEQATGLGGDLRIWQVMKPGVSQRRFLRRAQDREQHRGRGVFSGSAGQMPSGQ